MSEIAENLDSLHFANEDDELGLDLSTLHHHLTSRPSSTIRGLGVHPQLATGPDDTSCGAVSCVLVDMAATSLRRQRERSAGSRRDLDRRLGQCRALRRVSGNAALLKLDSRRRCGSHIQELIEHDAGTTKSRITRSSRYT